MAQYRSAVQFSVLVLASLVAVHETAIAVPQPPAQPLQVQAQVQPQAPTPTPIQAQASAPVQPKTSVPVVKPQVQPLQVALGQPKFFGLTTLPTTTTTTTITPKPVVGQITKLEIKPVIRIETATRLNSTTTPKPKNRMKIVKAADLKPAYSQGSSDKGFFSSLVDVERADNKSKVGVHIPLIFDMTNDKDISSGKSKLDLSVLSGLVSVNRGRENGKGPLTVTVFGIPVYTGMGNSGLRDLANRLQSSFTEQRAKFDDTLQNVAGSKELPDTTMRLYSNVKRAGGQGVTQLTDQLDKVSSFLKEQVVPISNKNGRPASKNDLFVVKPAQFKPEDMRPRVSESAFKKFAAATNTTAHDLHLQSL